jgi:Na+-translocating ferredoxin:NAD+ oxidoreductase RnfD subunit
MDFLLPAHITALAVSMLLYAGELLLPFAFAAAVAIGSKALFRAPVGKGWRHFLNPSNTGIATTLLLFPWVSIAPPYQFTENVVGMGDWFVPAVIVVSGTFLNTRFTNRMPLIVGWLGGFVLQALLRSALAGAPPGPALLPMTGMAFVLFTFYMVTDPATTPDRPWGQFAFGASVAAAYALLMIFHVVFGLFFALLAVCILRGLGLYALAALQRRQIAAVTHAEVVLGGATLGTVQVRPAAASEAQTSAAVAPSPPGVQTGNGQGYHG